MYVASFQLIQFCHTLQSHPELIQQHYIDGSSPKCPSMTIIEVLRQVKEGLTWNTISLQNIFADIKYTFKLWPFQLVHFVSNIALLLDEVGIVDVTANYRVPQNFLQLHLKQAV